MARKLAKREAYLLAALGAAAVFWVFRSWSGSGSPHEAAAAKASESRKEAAMGKVPVVHMDLLDRAVVKYDPAGRDLFKYAIRPPSVEQVKQMRAAAEAAAKAQKEAEERARQLAEEQKKIEEARLAEVALHPPPPPPPQPPTITFKFLGFVGPPNARVAALEQNDSTFVAKAGEIVQKDFRIDEIKYESVVISFVDPRFKGQVRELPLVSGK